MTLDDRFVRSVADWLEDQAGAGTPGYLDDVLTRTRQTRQRHWWASLERWLSMDTTMRLAQAPKLSMLLVVIGLLVALAAIVVVAGSQPRLPAPCGLAENGAVLYHPATEAVEVLACVLASDVRNHVRRPNSSARRVCRARVSRDLTVPTATPSENAISS